MYRRILMALGGKETDETALSHVQALALQMNAEVTLLWVIAVADDEAGGLGLQFQLEIGSSGWRRMNRAKTVLSRLEQRLREGGVDVGTALVIGTRSEADEIVGYAAQHGYDLIAMASDARPWYKRWIGGSPANGVLRKATVPTLFINDGTRKAPRARAAPKENKVMAMLGSPGL